MMNDSYGGGFSSQGNAEGKSGGDSKAEGTLPVFIKQILMQPEDTIKMFGFEYKLITTVVLVRNINHSSTKITYSIEDFSGRIEAHFWVEEGEAPTVSNVMLNSYARVIGAVRSQGGNKSIMIYKIDSVKGINEVNTHYLEVLNARYMGEEFAKDGGGSDSKMMDNFNSESGAAGGGGGGADGLKGKDLLVFQAIQTHGTEMGISRQELQKKFPQISNQELTNITDRMSQDGHVYTSIDSDHFLAVF